MDYAEYLVRVADGQRAKALAFGRQADVALADGSTLRAEHLWAEARRTSEDAAVLESKADQVRAGQLAPERVDVEPAEWIRVNDDVGTIAVGGVETGDKSAITGDDIPPPIDRSRAYGKHGGLRVPLAVHQLDLENAMPRGADGQVRRLADPRAGEWFALANDGGPQADPTRGINCVDGVLSLFETYVHGRPRVSAPRTFDSYAEGDPTRPLGAENHGLARIEETVRGEFQGLCPYVGGLSPEHAKQAVDAAMTNLHNHLYNAGHGAFAIIVTDSEEGTAHAWAAVNQGGTILFLDPQTAQLSEDKPLYAHTGQMNAGNVVSMDAVVIDGHGKPTPLPYHHAGLWSRSSLEPTGAGQDSAGPEPDADAAAETEAQRSEARILNSLTSDQRAALDESIAESRILADRVWADLSAVSASIVDHEGQPRARLFNEDKRVKKPASLARALREALAFNGAADASAALATIKDRVRFSLEVAEADYGTTVAVLLGAIERRGYQVRELVSFWGEGGRHNGLNVTLVDADDHMIELQFPTPLSRAIGDKTHEFYEAVRLTANSPEQRVEAFLKILEINKADRVDSHQPQDLEVLGRMRHVDSSFARWITKEPAAWESYYDQLGDTPFEDVLERHGLTAEDVFGSNRSGVADDRPGVPLSSSSELGQLGQDHEHDRLPGAGGQAAPGGGVGCTPQGVDLGGGPGGTTAVRQPEPRQGGDDRPTDGGTDRPGDSGNAASSRDDAPGDSGRGGTDGVGLRPASPVGEEVRLGQMPAALGVDFSIGARFLDVFDDEGERRSAELLGTLFDVRALDATHRRSDDLISPAVIVRTSGTDLGAYGALKYLDPSEPTNHQDPDFSRRVERSLREPFDQDPRIAVSAVDGRDVGLTIDVAVRGIRQTLAFWRQHGRTVLPEQRMIVFTGDGGSVVWRGDTGTINVSV